MAINIQSLFADIIDTPEQRQKKMLEQGMLEGRALASGLRGRAAALAPLAQVAGQLGVQRRADMASAIQPLMGIDTRASGEKLGDQIKDLDFTKPEDMLKAAQALQSIDPARAAALRQAAANRRVELQKAERELKRQQIADQQAANREARAAAGEGREILREQRSVVDWATGVVEGAISRRDEQEELNRVNNLRTAVANIARRSDPELASSIETADLTPAGLIDLQMKLTKDPDLKVRTQSVIGRDLIAQGVEVDNPDATYEVFVRTTEGENPTTNASDRIGAIISNSAIYQKPIDRPRKMDDETLNQLQTIVAQDPRFALFSDNRKTLVNEIYEYQEANPNAGRQGAVDAIVNNKLSGSYTNPINIEVNRDFLQNPTGFIPNLPDDFFEKSGVSKYDTIQLQVLTDKNIKEQKLDPKKYQAGNTIITYPVRDQKGLVIENGVPKTKKTLIR